MMRAWRTSTSSEPLRGTNGEELQAIKKLEEKLEKKLEEIIQQLVHDRQREPDVSVSLLAKYEKLQDENAELHAQLEQSQNTAKELQGNIERLSNEARRLNTSFEQTEGLRKEYNLLADHMRQSEFNNREKTEKIGILQKKNNELKEELDGLRATVVGAEFQAWDLSSLLKQYSSTRERWVSQFLFLTDGKDGDQLASTVANVFRWSQSAINDYIKAVTRSMYDFGHSETNKQFVRGTLQSNYARFESDLRNKIITLAQSDADGSYHKLKDSFMQSCSGDSAETNFDKLFNDIIKVCGMLVLCEPRLDVVLECNQDDPKTFDVRITTAETFIVCFPGLVLKEATKYRLKEKICVARPE